MKQTKRILSFVFALLMLVGALAACGNGKGPSVQTEPRTVTAGDDNPYDANGYIKTSLPIGQLNYGNTEINIYVAEELMGVPMFDTLDASMDIVDQATYKSDEQVKADLGVTFVMSVEPSNEFYSIDPLVQKIERQVMSGSRDVEMISFYLRKQGMVMINGLLYDLTAIEGSYIDYDKPWWPNALINSSTIGDSLYYVGGDISNSYLYNIWAMFYNINMVNNYQLEAPTDLVMDGQWTLEKFMEMSRNIRTGDNLEDGAGVYGYTCVRYDLDAFFFGSGLNVLNYDETENRVLLSADYFGEKAIDLVDTVAKYLKETDVYLENDTASHFTDPTRRDRPIFNAGRALFHTDVLTDAKNLNSENATFKWGVLPIPKYNAQQQGYISTCRPGTNRVWSIVSNETEERALMCTAVLEDLGSEGYRRITPAVFEICMKLRYSVDEINSKMFDYIRSDVMFDLGQSISLPTSSYLYQAPAIWMASAKSWKTKGAVSQKSFQATADEAFEKLLEK